VDVGALLASGSWDGHGEYQFNAKRGEEKDVSVFGRVDAV
jgi:hypothetical protein